MEQHFLRRGIAAVRPDAFYLGRQVKVRGHQHRGGAHGDAHKEQRRLSPKAAHRLMAPIQTVVPLPDAEGDGLPLALAVAALVYQQGPQPFLRQMVKPPLPSRSAVER